MDRIILGLFLTVTLCASFINVASADTRWQPPGCVFENYSFVNSDIKLGLGSSKTSAPQLFVFYNTSPISFWIDHQSEHPAASAGWGSQIDSKHWSAAMLTQNDFNVVCNAIKPGSTRALTCSKVLQVCQLSSMVPPKGTTGGFWVAENKATFSELMDSIKSRGFVNQADQ